MTTPHHSQLEFSQVTPHIYLGTNLCCTLKPHIQTLLDLRISAEINLEREKTDTIPDVPLYLWLPVPDKTAPSSEQLEGGVALIERMVQLVKKVYIHCQYGHGRSPTLVAAYFVSTGMSVEEAIRNIKVKRPEIHLERVQRQALEEYYSNLGFTG